MSIELADLSNFPPVNGKLAALHKIQTETLPADLSNFPPVNGKLAALHKIQSETLPDFDEPCQMALKCYMLPYGE